MEPIHSLLKRQLKRHFGNRFKIPPEWEAFVSGVNEAYREFDADRHMLEHSLELSSQELLNANSEMRAVFQAIPDLVFRIDSRGVILDVKAGSTADLMLRREQLIGKRIQDSLLTEVGQQFEEAVEKVSQQHVVVTIEYSAVLRGVESFYEARLVPLPDKQIVVIIRNISERKQSLRLLGAAVEQSLEAIIITDADLDAPGPRIIFVNPAFERMTGYRAEEVIGKSPRILQGPKSDRATLTRMKETLKRGESFEGQTINYRKDGTGFNMEWRITPIRNSNGTVTNFLAIERDITERITVAAALKDSDARYRALFEGSADGILIADIETQKLKYANQALCRMFGYTEGEIAGLSVRDIHPPEAMARVDIEFAIQARGDRLLSENVPCRRKDGSIFHADINGARVMVDGHLCNVGIFRDISARKRAEEALRQTTEKFQQLVDNITDVFWIRSPDMKTVLYVSPGFERIWGRSKEELYTEPEKWVDFIFPDDRDRVNQAFEELKNEKGSGTVDIEYRILRPEGALRWVRVRGFQIRDSNGRVVRLTGVAADITDLRHTQEKLSYERDLLRALLDNSPDHIYFKDRQSRFIKASAAMAHIFGVTSPDLLVGKTDFDFFTDEHARPAFDAEQEIIRTGKPVIGIVEREVWKDGRETWALTTKMPFRDAAGNVIGTFGISRDISELKRTEAALVETSALLENLMENTTDHIYYKDRESRFVHFSRSMLKLFHMTRPEQLKGKTDFDVFAEEHARPAYNIEQEIIRTGEPVLNLEEREVHQDGHVSWVLTSKMPWRDKNGNVIGTMGISRNITDRKRMEDQLFQSQKMETVGKLAGGIAHEFNSILTAIIGQSELMLEEISPGDPLSKSAVEIREAANRAALLTRQLLAYGRRQFLRPEPLDLNHVIASMDPVLRHIMRGEALINISIVPGGGLRLVKADAGQIEQVILNIVLNARDAMPRGGTLTLETTNVTLSAEKAQSFSELKAGDYVLLAITDTGAGMKREVRERAFEPFFTTKGVGQGTGLGLAMCYGIIKQSGGHISISSEVGKGTTLKIYLPAVPVTAQPPQQIQSPGLPRGTESILLVEDDDALREMAAALLGRLGYTVIAVASAADAINLKPAGSGHIDLLLTELEMPGVSGSEVAAAIRARHPDAKVLFTSAYAENVDAQKTGAAVLQKPFTPATLAHKLREVLGAVS